MVIQMLLNFAGGNLMSFLAEMFTFIAQLIAKYFTIAPV